MKIIISENQLNELISDLTELYLDGNYPPLYHSSDNIEEILRTDLLKMGKPYKGSNAICLTRNPGYTVDNRLWPRLKLDQNKLRKDGFIPKPIDEFGNEPKSQLRKFQHRYENDPDVSDEDHWKTLEWESEERIYSNIPNLHKYIISIQIPPTLNSPKAKPYPYTENIKKYAEKYPHIKLENFSIVNRWKTKQIEEQSDLTELTQFKEGNLKLIYRDPKLSVVVPTSPEASTLSARNTGWCTKSPRKFLELNETAILFRFFFKNGYKLRLTWDRDGTEFTWGSGGKIYREIRSYGNPFNQNHILKNDVDHTYKEILSRDFYKRDKDKIVHNKEINQNISYANYYKLVHHIKLDIINHIKQIPPAAIEKVLEYQKNC